MEEELRKRIEELEAQNKELKFQSDQISKNRQKQHFCCYVNFHVENRSDGGEGGPIGGSRAGSVTAGRGACKTAAAGELDQSIAPSHEGRV